MDRLTDRLLLCLTEGQTLIEIMNRQFRHQEDVTVNLTPKYANFKSPSPVSHAHLTPPQKKKY